jgi:hypothetical protein
MNQEKNMALRRAQIEEIMRTRKPGHEFSPDLMCHPGKSGDKLNFLIPHKPIQALLLIVRFLTDWILIILRKMSRKRERIIASPSISILGYRRSKLVIELVQDNGSWFRNTTREKVGLCLRS